MRLLDTSMQANLKQLEEFEAEKNAIMAFDALVKNNNNENSALGAAFFNGEKMRVEENNIDLQLLKRANPEITKKVFLKKLWLSFKGGRTETIFDYPIAVKNCIGISRFVKATGEKALLEGVVCVE